MSGAFGPDRRLLAAPDPAAALRPRDPGLRRRSARARTVAFGERRGLPEPRCRFRGPAAEPAARHPRPRERPADPGPPGGSLRQTAVRPARAADGRAGARQAADPPSGPARVHRPRAAPAGGGGARPARRRPRCAVRLRPGAGRSPRRQGLGRVPGLDRLRAPGVQGRDPDAGHDPPPPGGRGGGAQGDGRRGTAALRRRAGGVPTAGGPAGRLRLGERTGEGPVARGGTVRHPGAPPHRPASPGPDRDLHLSEATAISREATVSVRDLHKSYGAVEAVRGIAFEMRAGECFGLLGPNGAGKTTTIEILEGLIAPTAGEVVVLGRRWGTDDREIRERLGVCLQQTVLSEKLEVGETVALFRSLYREGRRSDEVIAEVGLTEKRQARVGTLSGGQKQRLAVACALVGDPELLFLDEPTTGLDPQSRRQLWGLIEDFRATGRTILLTTHYMDEAERLCERVAIVDHGHVIAMGTPSELIETIGSQHQPPPVQRTTSATLEDVFVVLTGRTLRDD